LAKKRGGGGCCEFCQYRSVSDLHHRVYGGNETLSELMAVCRLCHSYIEELWGFAPGACALVREGSLFHRGDTGRGVAPLWLEYLEQWHKDEQDEKRDGYFVPEKPGSLRHCGRRQLF
jgi:hypothetical protein